MKRTAASGFRGGEKEGDTIMLRRTMCGTSVSQPKTDSAKKERDINKFKTKSVEWLAENLFKARNELAYVTKKFEEGDRNYSRQEVYLQELKDANRNMAKVLQANGITPTPLLIKYLEVDCAHCDSYSTDENDNPTCDVYWPEDEDCCWQEALEKISFWTFVTDSNDLKGIASDFKDFHREVTEILDADGRVLWKANEEKVEQ